ncbi:MAG: futalosine hydrolase [Tepidisphaera sp.]|nr:futalosine hydrolase [Tepidisphaera sp.]
MDFVRTLLVFAAPAELDAGLRAFQVERPTRLWTPVPARSGVHLVQSGVGKANAAACVAWCLSRAPFRRVISVGIAGALPGSGLDVGDVVVADGASLADEGVQTPDGFSDIAAMGFGPGAVAAGQTGDAIGQGVVIDCDAGVKVAGATRGVVATVSTCSGTDAAAAEIVRRTGAIAEDMESAAIGFTARRLGAGFGGVRVISNFAGDRARQQWNLSLALTRMSTQVATMDI